MNEAIKYISYSGEVLDYLKRKEPRNSSLHKKLQESVMMLGNTIDLLQDIESKVKNNIPLEEVEENSETISEEN